MTHDFEDYYELLELSPNASLATIERVFRYFATKWHPDAGGEKEKFVLLVRAFETLRDPAARAAYDAKYQKYQERTVKLVEDAGAIRRDSVDRHHLLSLFYARRRQDLKRPGLGITTVERLMNCPAEILEFHLWYFREKGWIKREDHGAFAITADGVDRVESSGLKTTNDRLLECQPRTEDAASTRELASAS